ncbi:MAG: hypothetical protein HY289_02365 [Planctomycetes bacterium]|nr:hypothetical protein [Planctomycetota bacterium]
MPEQIQFNPGESDRETYIKLKAMDLESGWLGRVFGSPKNAAVNIGGLVAILVVIAGVIMTFFPGGATATETWKIVTPIVTMVLGFLFGKKA